MLAVAGDTRTKKLDVAIAMVCLEKKNMSVLGRGNVPLPIFIGDQGMCLSKTQV